MGIEQRLRDLGIVLPTVEGSSYYGAAYGSMKPFHINGNVLHLSGHVAERDGGPVHPGRLGESVTLEQGIAAARLTGLNALAGMKQALGSLDRVQSLIKSLNFVACAPGFDAVHKVSSGMTDLLLEILGPRAGLGCRATIGVQGLARNHCFETWIEVQID